MDFFMPLIKQSTKNLSVNPVVLAINTLDCSWYYLTVVICLSYRIIKLTRSEPRNYNNWEWFLVHSNTDFIALKPLKGFPFQVDCCQVHPLFLLHIIEFEKSFTLVDPPAQIFPIESREV